MIQEMFIPETCGGPEREQRRKRESPEINEQEKERYQQGDGYHPTEGCVCVFFPKPCLFSAVPQFQTASGELELQTLTSAHTQKLHIVATLGTIAAMVGTSRSVVQAEEGRKESVNGSQ